MSRCLLYDGRNVNEICRITLKKWSLCVKIHTCVGLFYGLVSNKRRSFDNG